MTPKKIYDEVTWELLAWPTLLSLSASLTKKCSWPSKCWFPQVLRILKVFKSLLSNGVFLPSVPIMIPNNKISQIFIFKKFQNFFLEKLFTRIFTDFDLNSTFKWQTRRSPKLDKILILRCSEEDHTALGWIELSSATIGRRLNRWNPSQNHFNLEKYTIRMYQSNVLLVNFDFHSGLHEPSAKTCLYLYLFKDALWSRHYLKEWINCYQTGLWSCYDFSILTFLEVIISTVQLTFKFNFILRFWNDTLRVARLVA